MSILGRLSGVTLLALAAGIAHAGDGGEFQVTPSLGYAHVRVEGRHLEFGESTNYEGLGVGLTTGYRAPFGLVVELGLSSSGNPAIGWATGGELRELCFAAGYDFKFGKGWHVTPKLGLTSWKLESGALESLVDSAGREQDSLDGDDPFVEVGLARELNPHIELGVSVRHAETSFGNAGSVAVTFTWNL